MTEFQVADFQFHLRYVGTGSPEDQQYKTQS